MPGKAEDFLLPVRATDRPCSLTVGSARVELLWVAVGVWQISERVGVTRVQHGQLRLRAGFYQVVTASGVHTKAVSWERAIRMHLGTR